MVYIKALTYNTQHSKATIHELTVKVISLDTERKIPVVGHRSVQHVDTRRLTVQNTPLHALQAAEMSVCVNC